MSDDRLLVRLAKPVEQIGSIIVPDDAKQASIEGLVCQRGPLSKYEVDEEILFSKYAGVDILFENEPYKLLRDSDVCAVIGGQRKEGVVGFKPIYVSKA